MAQKLMTPGVYIEEKDAFPGSVVEVATAIPAFIGYTEKAERNGRSLVNKPTRITSFADYILLFGRAFHPKFKLLNEDQWATVAKKHIVTINGTEKAIVYADNNELFMYRSIQLFFANGGGTCYIVSVGTYEGKNDVEVTRKALVGETENEGLQTLLKEQEPTMIVVPDAIKLKTDECYGVYSQVLAHCAKMQSRVAILDVHDGYGPRINAQNKDVITVFREKVGSEFLNYAAAYYPWLHTSIIASGDITFKNLDSTVVLKDLLPSTEKAAKQMLVSFKTDTLTLFNELMTSKKEEFEEARDQDGPEKPKNPFTLDKPIPPTADLFPDADELAIEQEKFAVLNEAYTKEISGQEAEAAKYESELSIFKEAYEKYKDAFDKTIITETFNDLSKDFVLSVPVLEPEVLPPVDQDTTGDGQDNAGDGQDNAAASDVDEQPIIPADPEASEKFVLEHVKELTIKYKKNKERNHHLGLIATSPTYANLLGELTEVENLLPPSAAMAGLYTMVDNTRGVWKSPANVSVNSVIKPSLNITHDDQELLNVDAMSGKSINAIRTFPGIGTMVWGGRTLDGNSLDWRYINVRRTIIMLEQSIKLALRSYVFEPNDANTWVTVKSMIVNFLTEKWKQGALAGASPEDAFDVQIGLGSTMTSLDILEGKMLVTIKLAIVRPAEFIVVTFQQQMQKS